MNDYNKYQRTSLFKGVYQIVRRRGHLAGERKEGKFLRKVALDMCQ